MVKTPVVGTAYVRVKVISDQLGNDISNSVRRGFRSANGDIDSEGRSAGRRAGRAAAGGVDDAAPDLERSGRRAGERVGNSMRNEINRRQRPRLNNLFKGLGGDLTDQFNLGIGAARMGRGIVGALVAAGPSVIAGAASLATALATEMITVISAFGPGIAGALGVGLAGVSSLAVTGGLLYLAFKSSGDVLKDVGEQFTKLKEEIGKPIAQGMLAGLTNALGNLRNTLVPQLQDLLTMTGESFGALFDKLSATLTSEGNVSRIREILLTNNDFINNLSTGLSGLVTTFLTLFKAAKPFVDYIGQAIANFGQWAEAASAAGEANGGLQAWMQRSLDKFKELWDVIKSFGEGIWNVFKAAAPVGADLMESLGGIGDRFVAWTSDEGNMARMTAFFEKAHTLSGKIFEILGKAFAAGGRAFENMNLDNILHVLDTLANSVGPGIAKIFNEIQEGAGPNLIIFFDNIGVALNKIADSGILEQVAGIFSHFMAVFSGLIATDQGAVIAGFAAAWLLFGGVIQSVLGTLFKLIPVLASVSAPVLAVAAAVAAAVGAFVLMWQNSENFRNSVSTLVSALAGKFSTIWEEIAPKVEFLWEKIQKLAGVIGDRLAPIISAITPPLLAFLDIVGTVLGYVFEQVGLFIDFIANLLSGDWAAAWDSATTMVSNFFDLIGDLFTKGRLFIGSLISSLGGLILDILIAAWNGIFDWTQQRWNAIYDFFNTILTNIADAIRSFGNAIPPFLASVWQWIQDNAIAAWNAVFDFFNTILTNIADGIRAFGNAIPPFLESVWNWVRDTAVNAWNAIFNFFNNILTSIADGIRSFGNAIPPFLEGIWNWVKDTATNVWNNIWAAVEGFLTDIYTGIQGFGNDIQAKWNEILSTASRIWDNVKEAIWTPIQEAYNKVKEWIDNILSIVKGVIDTVTNAYNTVTTKLGDTLTKAAEAAAAAGAAGTSGSVLTGGQAGVVTGGSTKLFQSFVADMNNAGRVMLAAGGTVRATPGGVRAVIGEGRHDERVEPLNANGMSNRDLAIINHILSAVTGTEGGVTTVNVRIGERELEDVVKSVITEHDRRVARAARNQRRSYA